MPSFDCIIVDDEKMSQKIIEELIKKTDFLNLLDICGNAIEASKVLANKDIDIMFLDVEMPEMTGLELISTLKKKPYIILITAKENYAVDAFEFDVVDYIVKPAQYSRFLKAINKVKELASQSGQVESDDNNIFIKTSSKIVNLDVTTILYFEAMGDYVNIKTKDNKYVIHSTMKQLEEKLADRDFIRVHRSFIVGIKHIKDIEEGTLLVGEKIIPIGNSYKQNLMKRLNII